jgi:UDP-GlcNAc:undecaprenyl-phosphate GlcNAc-1-phosphate transferase
VGILVNGAGHPRWPSLGDVRENANCLGMLMVVVICFSAVCAWALTAGMRPLAGKLRWVAAPNPIIRDGRGPVPHSGGLAILVAIALTAAFWFRDAAAARFLAGCAMLAAAGLLDDLKRLSPLPKFGSQIAAVSGALLLIPELIRPLTGFMAIDAIASMFFVLTLVNAFNFVDVSDGLAATVAMAGCIGWIASNNSAGLFPVLASAAGACAGFLWWNRPPARIYMGDCGSHLLGFVLAYAALTARLTTAPRWILAAILWTAVPVFELVFITVIRIRKGLPWWKGSPDHYALRLQRAGYRKSSINILSGVVAIACSLAGRLVAYGPSEPAWLIVGAACAGSVVCWRYLSRLEADKIAGSAAAVGSR